MLSYLMDLTTIAFYVPEEVYADFKKNVKDRGTKAYKKWLKTVERIC